MIFFYVFYWCFKVIYERERVFEVEIKNCLLLDLVVKWLLCEYILYLICDVLFERIFEYLKCGIIFFDFNVMLMIFVWFWVDEFLFEKYQFFYGVSVCKSFIYI